MATGRAAPVASRSTTEWLTPVLVDYFSRDGSTLTMRLLASSPEIALEPRDTHELRSYELRYFAYLWGWSRVLDGTRWREGTWSDAALTGMLRRDRPPAVVGPPPWRPRALLDPVPGEEPMSRRCFDLAWEEFSRRAARLRRLETGKPDAAVRYYAEKHLNSWELDLARLPELRILAILRDPRDVYVSMAAFDRRRGTTGFGRARAASEEEFLAEFIERQRVRLRWITELLDGDRVPVVRYEDLVGDLRGVAARLGEWLGVELDADDVLKDRRMRRLHVTAGSPADSIGRWRSELAPELAERFERDLGSELRTLGF